MGSTSSDMHPAPVEIDTDDDYWNSDNFVLENEDNQPLPIPFDLAVHYSNISGDAPLNDTMMHLDEEMTPFGNDDNPDSWEIYTYLDKAVGKDMDYIRWHSSYSFH